MFIVCLPEMVQHTALAVFLASNLLPLTFLTARTGADLLVQNHVGSFISGVRRCSFTSKGSSVLDPQCLTSPGRKAGRRKSNRDEIQTEHISFLFAKLEKNSYQRKTVAKHLTRATGTAASWSDLKALPV